jgi:hypothetical protein
MVIENRQRQQQQLPQELPSATSTVFRNNSKSARQKNTSKHIPQSIAGCLVIRLCASLSALAAKTKTDGGGAEQSRTRPAPGMEKQLHAARSGALVANFAAARGKKDGSTSPALGGTLFWLGARLSLFIFPIFDVSLKALLCASLRCSREVLLMKEKLFLITHSQIQITWAVFKVSPYSRGNSWKHN